MLYVTCAATTLVVLAITLLALTSEAWVIGVAFIALAFAVFAVTGFIGLMLGDNDGA